MQLPLSKENWATIHEILKDLSPSEEDSGFKLIEQGDFIDDGKYSSQEIIFSDCTTNKFYRYYETRSGSYFTDYYYNDVEFCDVQEVQQTEIVVKEWVKVVKP